MIKKNKNDITIKVDSTDTEVEVDIIDQEDTLVFDDWEIPEGEFENETNTIANATDLNQSKKSSNGSQLAIDRLVEFTCSFKKEYKADFNIYPNPTVSEININVANTPSSIRVIDLTGREHMQSTFSNQINVSNLSNGTYFIQLVYPDHVESKKFIKS